MPGSGNDRSAFCCAKTNLFLHVVGKRPDSFHEIETVFWPVKKVFDRLHIDFSPGKGSEMISISCDAPEVPCGPSNLCWKAVELYFAASGLPPRSLSIHLEKRIPVSAGMGGGSSDCASTLLLMEEYFGTLGKEKLYSLAGNLGSDVPFFLDPLPSTGKGRGELLERFSVQEQALPLLFVSPAFPISAAWAYTHLDHASSKKESPTLLQCKEALLRGDLPLLRESLRNDLAPAIFHKFPLLSILQEALEEEGAKVLLSGSGPTLFALYPDEETLRKAKEKMEKRFQGEKLLFF